VKRLFTYLSPKENIENHEVIILIDTFRATTTINTLFNSGAKEVFVTDDIEKSYDLKKSNYILCGERQSNKIKGFDFSNSPSEILENKKNITNKKVVLNTTNGAKTFRKVNKISSVIAYSLVNLQKVVEKIREYSDVGIVCSGLYDNYSLEDHYTATKLIKKIYDEFSDKNDATIMSNKINFSKDIVYKATHYHNIIHFLIPIKIVIYLK
jgi:2-phosphosulfolactate phosphatase